MQKSIGIFYFSGTGNTEIISYLLGNELQKNGANVEYVRIEDVVKDEYYYNINDYDIVGIGYPVHAFNAPKIVYDFIKQMPRAQSKYTFIFKCAGSGFINAGSTTMIKEKLSNRGYDVFNESLYLLSSNVITRYPDELVKQLYGATIRRVKRVTEEILTGKMRRQKNGLLLRAASFTISKAENFGVRFFGKDLKVSKDCTRCSKCVKTCPRKNISMEGYKIKFGWKCMACLRCVYNCPQRAISPMLYKFAVFKDHYNVKEIIDNPDLSDQLVTKETKGRYKNFYDYIYNQDYY
jgi:ferredoxin/flavodoxin